MIDPWERIRELEAQIAERDAIIAAQAERIAVLEAKVEKLVAAFGQNSSNSSKPPSTDRGKNPHRNAKAGKGKGRRGAKKGHRGHHRQPVGADRVDEFVDYVPDECGTCGRRRGLCMEGEPQRHQVVEVPELRAHVIEHRLHCVVCPCGSRTRATLPEDVSPKSFGPGLVSLIGLLTGYFRLSKRRCADLLATVMDIELSHGTVSHLEEEVSNALEKAHGEALHAAQRASVGHVDETSWRQENRTHWLWVLVTTVATVFLIRPHRDTKSAKELLGPFAGTLISDRFSSYLFWAGPRQVCWAHLMRTFLALSEHKDGTFKNILGTRLHRASRQLFHEWHRFRNGHITRETLRRRTRAVRTELLDALHDGADGKESIDASLQSVCAGILDYEDALFTFLSSEGVDPTNNAAERALRHAVILRKTSFGTQSERGSRFLERIFTVVETLRASGQETLRFIHESVVAHRQRTAAPSLLLAT